jgi:hypothetical protein
MMIRREDAKDEGGCSEKQEVFDVRSESVSQCLDLQKGMLTVLVQVL